MIEVQNLCAGYNGADVICNISFKADSGETLCILGPNGCGKTTLLKSIARIIDYRGLVLLNGNDIAAIPRKELAKKIALLSQTTQSSFPYTVYDTVSMGRYAYSRGFLKNLSAEDRAIIDDIIIKMGIEDIKQRMIDELSGGQLQRIFLARTLAQTPELILLDEPANHLDLKYQIELLRFLKSWVKETGKTVIGVFHDLNLARRFGDTAIVLDGTSRLNRRLPPLSPPSAIAACGKIEEVMNSETLSTVYGIDIHAFMRESLEKWK